MQHHDKRAITTIYNIDKYSVKLGLVQSFAVSGDIMVHGDVMWTGGSSMLSNDVYNTVQTNSADWSITVAAVDLSSRNWNETYELVNQDSDSWIDTTDSVTTSAELWNQAYDTVTGSETIWNNISNLSLSADEWNNVYDRSSGWDDISTIVQSNSTQWAQQTNISDLEQKIETWDETTEYVAASADDWNGFPLWNEVASLVEQTSGSWQGGNFAYTSIINNSDNWDDAYTNVSTNSGVWNDSYNYISTLSGDGFAKLDSNGKLLTSQVPDLSITETYVVSTPSQVIDVVNNNTLQRGDVVIVTQTSTPYIVVDEQAVNFGVYNSGDTSINGFTKLVTDNVIRSVNSKVGPAIELFPQDIDDSASPDRKWVSQTQIDQWDQTTQTTTLSSRWEQAYEWMLQDSPTNNTFYNHTHFVNASGDTIDGDLTINGVFNTSNLNGDTLDITGETTLQTITGTSLLITDSTTLSGGDVTITSPTILGNSTVTGNLHVRGDIRVDGNAYLSAGSDGVINVGDSDGDQVQFHADISSDLIPSQTGQFSIGSDEFRWSKVVALSGKFDDLTFDNIGVDGRTILTGKTIQYEIESVTEPDPETGYDTVYNEETNEFEQVVNEDGGTITTYLTSVTASQAGVQIYGEPVGFDNIGGQLFPDLKLDGDMLITGAVSGRQASFASLTARNFVSEYESLTIRESDLTIIDGNIIQTGGNIRVESDIAHIDDENTYIRFQEDQMTFRCHDLNFIRLSEYPNLDDEVLIGDENDPVDFRVITTPDEGALFVDGSNGFVGVGTRTPQYKLHVESGEVKMPDGSQGGALLIPSGSSATRIDKTGSIRWNTDLDMYEGYNADQEAWAPLGTGINVFTDEDKDTYLNVDALDYDDSDTVTIYTAGCSGLSVTPNQTVIFAGDIRFDRTTVFNVSAAREYDEANPAEAPIAPQESDEFIFLMVNGRRRAIRLWDIPETTAYEEKLETFNQEDIVPIGPYSCSTGYNAQNPMLTIDSGENTYELVPHADDSDGDGLVDSIDPDDDNDGIPDYGDPDHPSNIGAVNTDGDEFMDPYDPDDDNDTVPDEQDIDPLNAPTGDPQPGDYDGDHIKDEFDPDHGLSHGLWDQFNSPEWEEINIVWEALDGQP
jgi:hypothetical protein